MPADASVYALQVADRFYLFRGYSHTAAGLYAVAIKLATVVFVAVRGFQYAWPPLAYSIESDEEAARLYSLVTHLLRAGDRAWSSAPSRCSGRWMVRLLAAPQYFDAHRALPWLALGWALYGLYLVFVVIAGRARVTSRNLPAAAAGLAVNVALLLLLVPALRARASASPARGSRCAAPTWRCSPSCTLLTRQAVRGRLRMAAPGAARRDPRRRGRVAASCCCRRSGLGGLLAAHRVAGARSRRCCC